MKPAFLSQMFVVPPNWKHMKLAGNGPATSSANPTWNRDLGVARRLRPTGQRDRRRGLGAVDRRVGAAAELRAQRARVRAVGEERRVVGPRVVALGTDAVQPPVLQRPYTGPVRPHVLGAVGSVLVRRVGDERVVLVVV